MNEVRKDNCKLNRHDILDIPKKLKGINEVEIAFDEAESQIGLNFGSSQSTIKVSLHGVNYTGISVDNNEIQYSVTDSKEGC